MTVVAFDPTRDKSYRRAKLGRDVVDWLAWLDVCETKRCVNPEHLVAETFREHMRRHPFNARPYWERMRRRTHCTSGHEFTEANTYWRADGRGRRCRVCRREEDAGRRAARRASKVAR